MQNKMVLALLMIVLITTSAFALEVTGTAPTLSGPGAGTVNTELAGVFNDFLQDELKPLLKDIKDKPEELIKAFGDAGIFASHGATQMAYGGYKTFAVTVGPMVGLRLPSSPFTIMNDLDNMVNKLTEEQDIKLGLNPQVLNVRVGINTSKFLLKNLYLGLHFGFMKLNIPIEGFSLSFNNLSLGATANYQLVAPISLAKGLFLWRGVNVGSGFIWQKTNINVGLGLKDILGNVLDQEFSGTGKLTIDPTLSLDFNVNTFVIPVEVTTAVRLLWFLNIPLGVGMDLGFGSSDLKVGMDAKISASLSGYSEATPGSLSISGGGKMSPTVFNLKAMTGIGLNFGPVVLDIPITWYFLDNGFSVGVSLGFVW